MTAAGEIFLSNAVQSHIKSGGTLHYEPVLVGKKLAWRLVAVTKRGIEHPVISATSGRQRIFRSADAVIRYHLSLYPEAGELTLPIQTTARIDEADDDGD